MTQVSSTSRPESTLENLVRLAKDRSARGNATRRDWQRVADIDPDRANRELREFLRRAYHAEHNAVNPYERRSRAPGALIGFLGGSAIMILLWVVLPYARDNWMEFSVWRDLATGGQFLSTLLVPIGIVIGVRWSQKRNSDAASPAPGLPKNPSFDEMLDVFERTQNVGRARVY